MKTLKLNTTMVDIKVLKQRAVSFQKGRYKMSTELASINKSVLTTLVDDCLAMQKALKKLGVPIERPKHYSETPEYKKGDPEDVVPAFLKKDQPKGKPKKPKRRRVRLSKRVRL